MAWESASTLPADDAWEFDFTWPGDRVLAMKDGPAVRLVSTLHRRDLTNRFAAVAATVAKLEAASAVIDGIIRPVEDRQLPAFPGFVPPEDAAAGPPIRLIAFDLLWFDGADIRRCPLIERRQQLRALLPRTGIVDPAPAHGARGAMLAEARAIGADGILARRRGSRYRPYARNGDWVRVAAGAEAARPHAPARDDAAARVFGFGQPA